MSKTRKPISQKQQLKLLASKNGWHDADLKQLIKINGIAKSKRIVSHVSEELLYAISNRLDELTDLPLYDLKDLPDLLKAHAIFLKKHLPFLPEGEPSAFFKCQWLSLHMDAYYDLMEFRGADDLEVFKTRGNLADLKIQTLNEIRKSVLDNDSSHLWTDFITLLSDAFTEEQFNYLLDYEDKFLAAGSFRKWSQATITREPRLDEEQGAGISSLLLLVGHFIWEIKSKDFHDIATQLKAHGIKDTTHKEFDSVSALILAISKNSEALEDIDSLIERVNSLKENELLENHWKQFWKQAATDLASCWSKKQMTKSIARAVSANIDSIKISTSPGSLKFSPDFSNFTRNGKVHYLTKNQALVAQYLADSPDGLRTDWILSRIFSKKTSYKSLAKLFRDNESAYEALVENVPKRKGVVRLKK